MNGSYLFLLLLGSVNRVSFSFWGKLWTFSTSEGLYRQVQVLGLNMRAGLRCPRMGSPFWRPPSITVWHSLSLQRDIQCQTGEGADRGTNQFVLDWGTQNQIEELFQGLSSFNSNLCQDVTSSTVYVTGTHIKAAVRLTAVTFSLYRHDITELIPQSINLTWKGAHHQPWHKWPLALGRGSPASWPSVLQLIQWPQWILQHRTHEPQTSPWAGIPCRWHNRAPSELRSCSPVETRENMAGGRGNYSMDEWPTGEKVKGPRVRGLHGSLDLPLLGT